MKDIPIFINNFNRFLPTMNLVESLLGRNYANITIIDNASEYPPLLEWYDKCEVNVCRLKTNEGSGALNKLSEFKHITEKQAYVWTDGDVVPINEAPNDFLEHMLAIAEQYNIPKLGLGLKIDDLPDHFRFKQEVINHESVFTTYGHIDTDYCRAFKAPVDTTFAINRTPDCGYNGDAFRTGFPYMARHIPWYYDYANLPEDEKLLKAKKRPEIGHWSSKS